MGSLRTKPGGERLVVRNLHQLQLFEGLGEPGWESPPLEPRTPYFGSKSVSQLVHFCNHLPSLALLFSSVKWDPRAERHLTVNSLVGRRGGVGTRRPTQVARSSAVDTCLLWGPDSAHPGKLSALSDPIILNRLGFQEKGRASSGVRPHRSLRQCPFLQGLSLGLISRPARLLNSSRQVLP